MSTCRSRPSRSSRTCPTRSSTRPSRSFRLGLDTRKADQSIRGTVSLPNGTGRSVRVGAFAVGEKAREATEAGADVVGGEELVEQVMKGEIDFDAAVATPDMMAAVGKAGRVLGPRGLMPNPKTGTVTSDIGKAVADIKGGKVEYRADRTANVHMVIGKKSFGEQPLENYLVVVDETARETLLGQGPLHQVPDRLVDDGTRSAHRSDAPEGTGRAGRRVGARVVPRGGRSPAWATLRIDRSRYRRTSCGSSVRTNNVAQRVPGLALCAWMGVQLRILQTT